jgi:hypothetical protein
MDDYSKNLLTQKVLQILQQTVPPSLYKVLIPFVFALEVVIGILNCFWGYRLFRASLFFFGFLIGAVFFGSLGVSIAKQQPQLSQYAWIVGFAAAIVGGFVLGKLSEIFYIIAVISVGALLGATITASAQFTAPLILVGAVVGGIIALFLERLLIIIATSVIGAKMTVEGLLLLNSYFHLVQKIEWLSHGERLDLFIRNAQSTWHTDPVVLAWGGLAIVGFVVQYFFTSQGD